jgi:AbrB family looped-hinge helix DNA binding protein
MSYRFVPFVDQLFTRTRFMPIRLIMTTFTQLTAAGQLTIPAAVRKNLGLNAGDPVQLSVEGGRIMIEPVIVTPKGFEELDQAVSGFVADHADAFERLADL